MTKAKCLALLTAYFLIRVHAEGKDDSNLTLSHQGSHYLFKLDNKGAGSGGARRSSRCTPCGNDPEDRREVTNYLDPEYRGNGADNLGYDWSPRAWGGPAFSNRMKNRGRPYANEGWDRERGGRQMPGNWNAPSPNRFNCDSCRMIWDRERERGSRTRFGDNNFSNRMGRWQDDRDRYQGEVATVTSPPIALRPEGRIAYVPSPGGEMYWDGVSGGGTRWDGFSNGISWLGGGTRPYDGSPRGDHRGYDQGPKRPDDYRDKNDGYFRPWVNEPNRGPPPRYYPAKGYGDRGPNPDQDARYNGYASKWHYGTTNQNGWNGNNMKWSYGSKNWDNRGGNYYGGKYDEDSNPLPHGQGGTPPSYGQGIGLQYGSGDSSSPYGQGGAVQYGQGGSVYYDQGKYIFHYGQGGSPQYPMFKPNNQYPQDGNPPPHPAAGQNYGSRPLRPQKPWDYNTNDRYDNREPGYSNINWIRPGPTDPGYSKPPSHGKYPSGGYDDKRKPWPSRPTSSGYGPGPGFPQGGTGYITGSVTYGGDRYPGGDPYGGRPNQGPNYGGNEYPGGQGGYPGPSGSTSYPGGSPGYPGSSVHPGGSGGHRHPGLGGSSGYPGGSGGSPYPGGSGGSPYPGGSGGSSYPGGSGGRPYPEGNGGRPYPEGSGGRPYPGGIGGSSYPGGSGGSSYPGGSGGSSYPGGSGGSSYPGGSGGSSYPGGSGGSSYPGGSGGSSYPGGSGGSSYPGGSGGSSYPGGSGGRPYPGGSGGSPYPGGSGGSPYPGGSGGSSYPGGSAGHGIGGSVYPGTTGDHGHPDGYRPGPGGFGQPGNLDRPGNYYGSRPPPKGYYTGFITELNPNKYPSGVHIGDGNRYPSGGSYPIGDKGSYPDEGYWNGNRYPGGDRYPSEAGEGFHPGHSDRYPGHPEGDRHRPGSQDRFPSEGNTGDDGNAWNYGQETHKDGIYRRAGGSYPPYRGGPYYTSSYLASASTPSGVSQAPSEGKTQSVTKADEVTKPTPESS